MEQKVEGRGRVGDVERGDLTVYMISFIFDIFIFNYDQNTEPNIKILTIFNNLH